MADDLFQSVLRVFSEAELVRAAEEIVAPLRLPKQSKEYLTRVGLPGREVAPGLDFNLVDRLPRLGELYPRHLAGLHASWDHARFLSLRYDAGVYFDEDDGATVWELDVFPHLDSRFVNASVELLGYFLAECNSWSGESVKESDARRVFFEMRERMTAADPRAFEDADCFWAIVLHDQELFL